MKPVSIIAVALLLHYGSSNAQAAITFSTSTVNNSTGGSALADYVTNDIKISFDGQYTGSQAVVQLTSGNIYQDPAGSAAPPSSIVVGVLPSLAFDTFVAQGLVVSGGPHGEPSIGGGAVDLGGTPAAAFNTSTINQAWNPAGGITITDQNDFTILRLTLSKDALGMAKFLASAGGIPQVVESPIVNGYVCYCGLPTEIVDAAITATVPEVVAHTFATNIGTNHDYTWGGFTFDGPGKLVPGAADPIFNPDTQEFTWPTAGWKAGTYVASAIIEGPFAYDTGTLTIELAAPEPTTLVPVLTGLLSLACFRFPLRK